MTAAEWARAGITDVVYRQEGHLYFLEAKWRGKHIASASCTSFAEAERDLLAYATEEWVRRLADDQMRAKP